MIEAKSVSSDIAMTDFDGSDQKIFDLKGAVKGLSGWVNVSRGDFLFGESPGEHGGQRF
jgi:hypothetical protein